MQKTSSRFHYLDSLRAFAAILVIYQHTIEVATFNQASYAVAATDLGIARFFAKTLNMGELGVVLFFMISGFVVPFSLKAERPDALSHFLKQRFFRLYPAYWLSVILGLILVWWQFGAGHAIDWPQFFVNLTMLQSFFDVTPILGLYWTLSLELVFYACCALLFRYASVSSLRAALIIMSLIYAGVVIQNKIPNLSPASREVFYSLRLIGYMFFGLHFRNALLNHSLSSAAKAIFMLALSFYLFNRSALQLMSDGDFTYFKTPLLQLIAVLIFIAGCTICRLETKLSSYLGEISYSLYLFHPVVFYPIFFYFWLKLPADWQAHTHLFFLLSLLSTIALSAFTYKFVERPAINFGRRKTGYQHSAMTAVSKQFAA